MPWRDCWTCYAPFFCRAHPARVPAGVGRFRPTSNRFRRCQSEFGLGIDFALRRPRGAKTAFLQIVLGEGPVDGADKERNEEVVTVFDRCHELPCFSQVALPLCLDGCATRPSVVSATLTVVPVLPPSLVPSRHRRAIGICHLASACADIFSPSRVRAPHRRAGPLRSVGPGLRPAVARKLRKSRDPMQRPVATGRGHDETGSFPQAHARRRPDEEPDAGAFHGLAHAAHAVRLAQQECRQGSGCLPAADGVDVHARGCGQGLAAPAEQGAPGAQLGARDNLLQAANAVREMSALRAWGAAPVAMATQTR